MLHPYNAAHARRMHETAPLTARLVDDADRPLKDLTGYTVQIVVLDQDETPLWHGDGAVVDGPNARIQYQPAPTDLDTQGTFLVGWWVSKDGDRIWWPPSGYERLEVQYAPPPPT